MSKKTSRVELIKDGSTTVRLYTIKRRGRESRPTFGFFIAKLSDDYLHVEKQTAFIKALLEGGALVHYHGLYYVIGSHMTGWRPNPNVYATAKKYGRSVV